MHDHKSRIPNVMDIPWRRRMTVVELDHSSDSGASSPPPSPAP